MIDFVLKNPTWYQALTLKERAATLAAGDDLAGMPLDEAAAARRWQQWSGQAPFNQNSHYLERRLGRDNLTDSQFRYILGETPAALQARLAHPPAWLNQLADAYSNHSETPPDLPDNVRRALATTFLAAVTPLIHQTYHRLQTGLAGLPANRPFDNATITAALMADLPDKLLIMMNRTMALEMRIAGMQGALSGSTPNERFLSFVDWLGRPANSLKIWQEYTALIRLIVINLDHWLAARLEFLARLCQDYSALAATFSPDRPAGHLISAEGGLGDAHDNGRSVMSLSFDSGLRLIYKPRSLASSQHFQELLQWLNERGSHLGFRLLRVLDRGGYGWVEFVDGDTCQTSEQVGRFYRRLGAFLALLYAIRATDFHYQNIIAAGEHPVLIDLETFFQPPAGESQGYRPESAAYHALMDSVIRVGLLPQRLSQWLDDEPTVIDFSGLGAAAGQVYNKLVPKWEGSGTDEMRLGHSVERFEGAQNRPTLNGAAVTPLDYSDELTAGFAEMYQLILDHRDAFMADDGPLAAFAGDAMRIVLRATMIYSMMLKDGRHPDLLRNNLDRERHWDRLWIGIDYQPEIEAAIAHERNDLSQDDIPLFWIQPASRDLWTASGERIPDYFPEPGDALTRRRLMKLSPADLQQQLWFIRAALSTLMMRDEPGKVRFDYQLDAGPAVSCEGLIAEAEAIGDRLEELALWYGDEVGWLGLSINREHWALTPLGYDLYGGVPGVTLFLAYLGAITGRDKYSRLAQAALHSSRQEIEGAKPWLKLIGGFSGWGGAIYLYSQLGLLWQQPALLDEAETMAAALPAGLIEQDVFFDVAAGAAGCLVALLGLYQVRPNPKTLAQAIRCGERLLAGATPQAEGIGWIGPMNSEKGLAGFAHGTAGIAWALLQLAAVLDKEAAGIGGLGDENGQRFQEAALAALGYERSLFSAEAGNWPDLRPMPADASPFPVAWCHGAAGIGLARVGSLAYLDDEIVRQEIETAVQTTIRSGFGRNHSLCHGDLGNLELLAQAVEVSERPDWLQARNQFSNAITAGIRQNGPLCGVPYGLETPGLMNGLAGIGYGLLRLAAPEQVPAVLLLQSHPH